MTSLRFVPPAIAALALAGAPLSPASADIVTLGPAADTTLYEDAQGSLANGAGQHLFAGTNGTATFLNRRGLISFDVAAALPAGATITDEARAAASKLLSEVG